MAEALSEKLEAEKKQCNIILINLPESVNDGNKEMQEHNVAMVQEAISKIDPEWMDETLMNPITLGKRNLDGKPRLLKLKVKNNEVRDKILRNAYKINKDVQDPHK